MDVNKYLRKPTAEPIIHSGLYERYNLKENPFPSTPFINPESSDARINGSIYEPSIRRAEYDKISQNFLQVRLNDPNHLRLGYIVDESYVVRGNGKSAFILDLQRRINQDFGLSVSQELNKCFAIVLTPEPSGRTKTFDSFVHLLADAIFRSNIIEDALTTLRLEAILALDADFDIEAHFKDEAELRDSLKSSEWYAEVGIDLGKVNQHVLASPFLTSLPRDFPLFASRTLWPQVASQESFFRYYQDLRRGDSRTDFVFSHLISLFIAAGFNGAYVFVDDFERIPEFQSEKQRRDFARGLRTCLFDGLYTSARAGFYTFMLVLHAGVPRLVQNAWDASGLEHRAPIFSQVGTPKHLVRFEKMTLEHAISLLQKYLKTYRMPPGDPERLFPFTEDAVAKISELSDFNASRILKMAYEVLERAVEQDAPQIDVDFIMGDNDQAVLPEKKQSRGIKDAQTKDLLQESQ